MNYAVRLTFDKNSNLVDIESPAFDICNNFNYFSLNKKQKLLYFFKVFENEKDALNFYINIKKLYNF